MTVKMVKLTLSVCCLAIIAGNVNGHASKCWAGKSPKDKSLMCDSRYSCPFIGSDSKGSPDDFLRTDCNATTGDGFCVTIAGTDKAKKKAVAKLVTFSIILSLLRSSFYLHVNLESATMALRSTALRTDTQHSATGTTSTVATPTTATT